METSFVQGPGRNEGIMDERITDVPSLQDILTCEEAAAALSLLMSLLCPPNP